MVNVTLVRVTRYASLVCGGVLAGVALTVLFVELAFRGLDGPAYVRVRQAEFGVLTLFIAVVFVPTLVAVVALVVFSRRAGSSAFRPAVVALGLFLVAAVITIVVNGPINFQQLGWSAATPPADWASVRDRWQIAHAVRTLAIVVALGYLATAVIDRPFGTDGSDRTANT